jgi:hypothetical protein
MITEKPFAPRPVKKNSNILAIKIETGFDNLSKFNSNSSSSLIRRTSMNFEKSLSPEPSRNKCKNYSKEEDEFYTFNYELNQNISDESAKSEIISILNRNDSTLYASFNGKTESCVSDENRLTSNLCEDELTRFTFPPIRSSNPFYKNFSCASDEEHEVDLNVFNFSSKIFLQGGTLEN